MLVIAMPLLALLPIALLLLGHPPVAVRRVPVWYGGAEQDAARTATTALTFSNALRTFYSFIYRPTIETTREINGARIFRHPTVLQHDVAPVFGPYLFAPGRSRWCAPRRIGCGLLQSGHLNFYLGLDRLAAGDHSRVDFVVAIHERWRNACGPTWRLPIGGTLGCWARYRP